MRCKDTRIVDILYTMLMKDFIILICCCCFRVLGWFVAFSWNAHYYDMIGSCKSTACVKMNVAYIYEKPLFIISSLSRSCSFAYRYSVCIELLVWFVWTTCATYVRNTRIYARFHATNTTVNFIDRWWKCQASDKKYGEEKLKALFSNGKSIFN